MVNLAYSYAWNDRHKINNIILYTYHNIIWNCAESHLFCKYSSEMSTFLKKNTKRGYVQSYQNQFATTKECFEIQIVDPSVIKSTIFE